jgi:GAF domain-containing protein
MPKLSEICEAVVEEIAQLIDYDSCRVYVVEGDEARPVACRGEPKDLPASRLGEGIVGQVAASGQALLIANLRETEHAPARPRNESIIAVPLRVEAQVLGVVVVSKLGVGRFDESNLRLVEVLAGHAAVGLENARLQVELQQEVEHSKVWLEFADALAAEPSLEAICSETPKQVAELLEVEQCSLWLQDRERGDYSCVGSHGYLSDPLVAQIIGVPVPEEMPNRLFEGKRLPFVVALEEFRPYILTGDVDGFPPAIAFAPLPAGYGVRGWIAIRLPDAASQEFTDSRLRLLDGMAYRASMALQRALLYRDQQESNEVANTLLECAHELVSAESVEDKLRRILELAAESCGSPRATLWLEDQAGQVGLAAGHGLDWGDVEDYVPRPFTADFASQFLRGTEAFVFTPELIRTLGVPSSSPTRRFAVAPLSIGPDDRMGGIVVVAPEPGAYVFPKAKLRLLTGLANQARIVVRTLQPVA